MLTDAQLRAAIPAMLGWFSEAGTSASFKTIEAVRIVGEGLGQHLQRHVPAERGVAGAVDLPHAAFVNECGHVVVSEAGTDV